MSDREVVIICGDREWMARAPVRTQVEALPKGTLVITGGARGADTIGNEEAKAAGLEWIVEKADWTRFGRAAGPVRNQRMLEYLPTRVIAMHDAILESRGTADMVTRSLDANVHVTLVDSHGTEHELRNGDETHRALLAIQAARRRATDARKKARRRL